jgi:AraC-like DNA-binding protein
MTSSEWALRALLIFQCLLLIGVFARLRRPDHVPALGIAFAGSLIAFALTSATGARAVLGVLWWPLTAWCVAKPALLWIFSRALFADRYTVGAKDAIALLGLVVLGLWHEAATLHEAHLVAGVTSTLLLNGLALVFVVLVPLELWHEQRADLDPARRRVRRWVLPLAVSYLGLAVLWQVSAFMLGWSTPPAVRLGNLGFLFGAALAVFLCCVRIDVVDWLQLAATQPTPPLNANDRAVLARLQQRMSQPRWYANPSLSIRGLARELATNEQTLRQVIQIGLGFRHFTEFLHHHRLAEARTLLLDPQLERRSILSIALDTGFGSIGPFNRAFKAAEGCTPTVYRQRAARMLPATR